MDNLKISTMTAITSIMRDIDVDMLYSYIENNDYSKEQNVTNNHTNIGEIRHPLSKHQKIKKFKNQVQLHLPLKGDVSGKIRQVKIKVFNNGRLHITGSQSLDMVKMVLQKVNVFLCKAGVLDELFNEEIAEENIEIVMVNMTIDVGFKINQKVFRDLLINKYRIYADFSPKTYAGINAHYEIDGVKQASFLIFQSGKINIAGAKGMFHLLSAKLYIENIISQEHSVIKLDLEVP